MKHWTDRAWSMSGIKMLEKCPLQFYLKYVIKLDHTDPDQDTDARDLGLAMHYILELMQDGRTIAEAYEEAKVEHFDILGEELWKRVEDVLPHIHKFNRMMHDRDEAEDFIYAEPEKKLAIDVNFEPVDFFSEDAYFRGVIDYTARTPKQKSIVIDHKKGGGGFLTRYHSPQLSSYLVLDYFANEKFEVGHSYIYYIEAGELSEGPKIYGDLIESKTRPWLVNKIDTAIDNVISSGKFYHSRGSQCKYCEFESLCKNGARGTAGDLIKYVEESKELI